MEREKGLLALRVQLIVIGIFATGAMGYAATRRTSSFPAATSRSGPAEGCTLLPYQGSTPLRSLPHTVPGDPDFRGGMVCSFVISPTLPAFTFHFAGKPGNTFGNIAVTEGSSNRVIHVIPNSIDPNAISRPWQDVLEPVDANFDEYKDLPILDECGATGNCAYTFYFYDSSQNRFVQNAFWSGIGSFSVDPTRKQRTASGNESADGWENDTYPYHNGRYALGWRAVGSPNSDTGAATRATDELPDGRVQLANATSSYPSKFPATTTLAVSLPFKGFVVRLFAPDQKISMVPGDFCGGADGATMAEGTYRLIAEKNGRKVSTLPLGDMIFIAGTPHDGLHLVTYERTGDQFIVINRYGNCLGDDSSFYTINGSGKLVRIPFVAHGTSTLWVRGGFSDPDSKTDGIFCGYDNAVGYDSCDAYRYKDFAFIGIDSWIGPRAPSEVTDVDRAKRYLIDWGDSAKAKPYLPSDARNVDGVYDVQTTAPAYRFEVDFAGSGGKDYRYLFEVKKVQKAFRVILPPRRISQ